MKRIWLIVILFSTAGAAFAADHALISAGVSVLQPADSGYREVYGQRVFYPEVQAGVRLVRGLYLMGGFGMLTKKGETPELRLDAKSTQMFFSAGLAYILPISASFRFKVAAGVADISYKEEAMGLTISGSKLGYQAEMGLLLMGEVLFAGVHIGYLSASDAVEDVKIKLGGARAGLCLGFRI
jgi:hypothetical protein